MFFTIRGRAKKRIINDMIREIYRGQSNREAHCLHRGGVFAEPPSSYRRMPSRHLITTLYSKMGPFASFFVAPEIFEKSHEWEKFEQNTGEMPWPCKFFPLWSCAELYWNFFTVHRSSGSSTAQGMRSACCELLCPLLDRDHETLSFGKRSNVHFSLRFVHEFNRYCRRVKMKVMSATLFFPPGLDFFFPKNYRVFHARFRIEHRPRNKQL